MKKIFLSMCAIGLLLSLAGQALAQAPGSMPPGPPKVLQIFREEVKVGKGPAHEKFETGFVRAFARAKWPTHYLAINSITGPGEAWFLSHYDSFEAWEKDQRATEKNAALQAELTQLGEKDAEFISGGRSIVLFYREELSHGGPVNIPQMRYFRVLTFRVRLGHEAEFAEAAKIVGAAYDKAGIPAHWATYQVYAGMPNGTFQVMVPLKSLKEIDDGLARVKALQEAEGEEGTKRLQKISSEAYQFVDSQVYAFSPKMSYVSKEFAAADPDFWTPKPAAKPAAGAPAEKKEPKSPAAPVKKESAKKSSTKQ